MEVTKMPVYEYWCHDCHCKVSVYLKGFSGTGEVVCPQCSGKHLTRLFSTFAVRKTDKDFYDDILSDNQLTRGMLANDPRALAEWSRRFEGRAGTQISPEYEEMTERLERGENWQKLATEMQEKEFGPTEEPPKTSEE
jgi:putative FmdB family regulatory protein